MLLAAALTFLLLEDFEDMSDMRASASRATATLAQSTAHVKEGKHSAELRYDFKVPDTTGTSAATARHRPAIKIEQRPRSIGLWVYGDGSGHWLRGVYRDGDGLAKDIDFTEEPRGECGEREHGINWTGWKYVQTIIPADAKMPLMWERILVSENSDACDSASSIYLDGLQAVYTDDDLVGPEISEVSPRGRVYTARPEISALVKDANAVTVTLDGEPVVATYTNGRVTFSPKTALADGAHRVRVEARDRAGNQAVPAGDWTFTVYTGPDREAPTIDRVQPLDGTTSRWGRPRLSVRIRDDHRGVDPSSIALTIDGKAATTTWDQNANIAWHAPVSAIANGTHKAALRVADRAGNAATHSWSFTVDAIEGKVPSRFTWIADGGYFEGAKESEASKVLKQHLEEERANKPDLLIFGGDIVENDQQVNYDRALAALRSVGAPFLVTAGNHEISGSLSRDRFWRTFGPTIAAHDYGPVDFIVVDVANSEYAWDTSQYAWLEQELARSDARTVFVIHHAPTRDPFDSGHGIPPEEGRRVESILAAAKKAKPARDIFVMSGDAHAYARWTRDGVEYVISGGGGGGLDAAPDNGGFFHRLHIEVDKTGKASLKVLHLGFPKLTGDQNP
jgi:hypothetical protein